MPRRTKIIFIIVFIIVGAVMLGVYYAKNPKLDENGQPINSGYGIFNPFRSKSDSPNTEKPENHITEEEYVAPTIDKDD